MRVPPLIAFLSLSLVGLAQDQDKGTQPQRLGDLLVELARTNTPSELILGQGRFAPPADRYWVVADVDFRNAGTQAVCASFMGSLKAEYGLVARTSSLPPESVAPISELLPGEEARRDFVFTLKRGAAPLELTVEILNYGGGDCGNSLPRSASTSVKVPIRGVSTPKDEKSGTNASPNPSSPAPAPAPAQKEPAYGESSGGGVYRPTGGATNPVAIYKTEPQYSDEALKAKWGGTVLLSLVVDESGKPVQIKVVKPLGLGLDEKAIQAVAQWRFKPSMKNGKPVPAAAQIAITFHLPPGQ